MNSVSAVVTFHEEGGLAAPAIASLRDLVEHAKERGIAVETIAVLDTADAETLAIVAANASTFDVVRRVAVGDSARARSAGLAVAEGEHVAFLDGDDLWGEDWISAAHAMARSGDPHDAILHPEFVHFFDADDRHVASGGPFPRTAAASFVMEQPESEAPGFDRRALLLDNLWTANVFASRRLLAAHPFLPNDPEVGLGIEDWAWNLATVWGGIPHRVVPGTVHMVRAKRTGSQGQANVALGLLPPLPDGARLVL